MKDIGIRQRVNGYNKPFRSQMAGRVCYVNLID